MEHQVALRTTFRLVGGEAEVVILLVPMYWTPTDCPMRKEPSTLHHHKVNDMRHYLENVSVCRRKWLMDYFDPMSAKLGDEPMVCCDVCAQASMDEHMSGGPKTPA